MRAPSSTDFTVVVDQIGTFEFGKRRMKEEMAIQAEYRRLTEGEESPSVFQHQVGTWLATLKVLMVRGPDSWVDMDDIDPLDEDTYLGLMRIYEALCKKEHSFRRKPAQGVATGGPAVGDDDGVLVPSAVQPAAN